MPSEPRKVDLGGKATPVDDKPKDTPKRPTTDKAKRIGKERKLRESVEGTYQAIGMGAIGFAMSRPVQTDDGLIAEPGLSATGQALIEKSGALADAWMELADQNPKVKQALQRFAEGSATATLIGLHAACVLPLIAARGILPEALANPLMAMSMNQNGHGGE